MKNLFIDNKSACLITDRLTRKYLSKVDIAEGFLVVGKVTAYFTDARYFYAAKEKLSAVGIRAELYQGLDKLMAFIKDSGAEKLFVDYTTVTVKEFNEYSSYGITICDFSDRLINMRSIKDDEELSLIEKACEIAEKAYHASIKTVKVGMTETELKNTIENNIISLGGDGASFDIIVAFGSNAAVPHHETGNTILKENNVILVDMGALVCGYMSDLTRTCYFGTPDDEFIRCYNAVLSVNLLAEEKIVSGIKASDADAIARNYLKEQGLEEYFTHSLGHGVGYEIHEFPTLSKRCDALLKENMVFTIEPGVYFDGKFGIRIEDTVVLKDGKVKRLFSDDKSLEIIK